MARRQIGTPRFYCDIPSYLKSIGSYYGVSSSGFQYNPVDNKEKPFNMNPYQINELQLGESLTWAKLRFWINQEPVDSDDALHIPQYELGKLLAYHNTVGTEGEHHSSGCYAGVLGHNLVSAGASAVYQRFWGMHDDGTHKFGNQSSFREIVNFEDAWVHDNVESAGKPKYDGFSLWEITGRPTDNLESRYSVAEFGLEKNDGTNLIDWGQENFLKIGAYTTGIFIEPPHSPDLSVDLTLEQGGIKVYETVGGNSLVNINHQGVPNWGDQPAWTLQKTDGRDYTTVASRSRRNWKLSFSYISDDNLFDAAQNSNSFYNDTFTDGGEDSYGVANFDTSMSTFFKLTKNGNLPFIFCPDSKATRTETNLVDGVEVEVEVPNPEFAICMLDQDSISFKQIAYQTWNVSMNVREVW